MRPDKLDVLRASVLVIDVQEKLLPGIARADGVVSACRRLLDGARIFDLPIVVTEQYPKGLGSTERTLRAAVDTVKAQVIEKPTFSAWEHEPIRRAMLTLDRPQVIVAGIETHICVQQTVLDLRSRDYDVYVCADAVGARSRLDHDTGIQRMGHAGAHLTTVESVLFELCHRCDTSDFKKLLAIIKSAPPRPCMKGESHT